MPFPSRGKKLHKTNPALFDKLSNDSRKPTSVLETDDKSPFPETPDDASDIPLEVVQQHLASGLEVQAQDMSSTKTVTSHVHLSHRMPMHK